MGKDSVLGSDPLNWMKIAIENKKLSSLNNEKLNQETNLQETGKRQESITANSGETQGVTGIQQPVSKVSSMPGNTTTASEPKAVIGGLYEKPSPKGIQWIQHSKDISQEKRHQIEPSFPGMRTVQPMERMKSEVTPAFSLSSTTFSTYIIIAYTALMLILGYLVYNDFSKRTNRIEARLSVIEKTLQLRK